MNRGVLFYLMVPLLLFLALLQSTAASRIQLGQVKPDLVLIMVIVGTLLYGGRSGVLWAFVGGLALDLFSNGPLGASSLALMAAALVASVGHRPLSRFNIFVPLSAAALGTLAYASVYLGILALLNSMQWFPRNLPFLEAMRYIVLPATLYNTAIMLLLLPLLNRMPESQDL
jgi:rod shape-determining protein MreD